MKRTFAILMLFFAIILPYTAVMSHGNYSIRSDLSGKKICIDPGHGGSDPGAVGPTGYTEKEANLDVGLKVRKFLEKDHATVIMTRTSDVYVSLSERCQIANTNNTDIFVSIHHNSASNPNAGGTETYYHSSLPPNSNAARLATKIQRNLVSMLGRNDRGVKTADFYVLRNTAMPAALAEVLFISNPYEESLMKNESIREKSAWAIYAGICEYFGVSPKPLRDVTPPGEPSVRGPFSEDELNWTCETNVRINWSEPYDDSGVKEYMYSFSDIFIEGENWYSSTSNVFSSDNDTFGHFSEKYAVLGESGGGKASYTFHINGKDAGMWYFYLRFCGEISVECDGNNIGNASSTGWELANFSANLNAGKHSLEITGLKNMTLLDYISFFKKFERTNETSIEKVLGDGKYAFVVHAVDYEGNIGHAPASDLMGVPTVIKIDSTPPQPPTVICRNETNESYVNIKWIVSLDTSPIIRVEMQVTGSKEKMNKTFSPNENSTFMELSDGNYVIKMREVNAAGLAGEYASHELIVDSTPPSAVNISPLPRFFNTTSVPLRWEALSDARIYHVYVKNVGNGTVKEYEVTEMNESVVECIHGMTYLFGVSAEDSLGNEGKTAWEGPVTIDITPPTNLTVKLETDYERCDVDGKFTATFSAEDYESHVKKYAIYAIKGNGTHREFLGETEGVFAFNLTPGKYEFEVVCMNHAMLSASQIFSVTVNIPPYPQVSVHIKGRHVSMESNSYDKDGSIVKYFWDMDGDGVWDIISDDGDISYVYESDGDYAVIYGVLDDLGVFSSYTFNVSIAHLPPEINFTVIYEWHDGNIKAIINTSNDVKFVEWSCDNKSWYRAFKAGNMTAYTAIIPADAKHLYLRAYRDEYSRIAHFDVDVEKKKKSYIQEEPEDGGEWNIYINPYALSLLILAGAIFVLVVIWWRRWSG